MEKGSSLSNINSLEDHNNGGRDFVGDGGDLLGGFSWPPRSYTCTFCKREFRSAQALGGHMNVHRRDRARLRQIPSSRDPSLHHHNFSSNYSLINLNLDPNKHPHPNPNSKPNLHSNPNLTPYCFSSMSSPLISSSPSSLNPNFPCVSHSTTHSAYRLHQSLTMMKSQISPYGVCRYDSFRDENEGKIVKNSEIVTLNLEIGLLGESKADELDLELRLGCS